MKKHLQSLLVCGLFLLGGLAIGFVVPRAYEWLKPKYVEGDYSAYLKGANSRVVLYSTSWCPYCAKVKAYFDKNKIAYTEMDIEKSEAARQQHIALGGGPVPKVLIGNRMIVGFIPDAFDAALSKVVASNQ
jgi:glutaredoxin